LYFIVKILTACNFLDVVDLYFTEPSFQTVKIIDFGPLDAKETDGILFEWNELLTLKITDDEPIIRLISSQNECRLGFMRLNTIPIDWVQLMKMQNNKIY